MRLKRALRVLMFTVITFKHIEILFAVTCIAYTIVTVRKSVLSFSWKHPSPEPQSAVFIKCPYFLGLATLFIPRWA